MLGIARLLPESGFGLWLRLAAATLVLLLPGRLVARCLGQRTASATLVWSVVLVGLGLALTFALGGSLDLALALVLAAGAVALGLLVAERPLEGTALPAGARLLRSTLVVGGLGLGAGVWFVQGAFTGDAFFHLGRVRKLDALSSLSLHDVGEFTRGGLHPGYAFPLWHGWIALVARLAGVDPTSVARHESSLLVPLALVLAFELGWAVFRSTRLGFAVMLGQLALKGLAPGHGGVYPLLWQPGTAATQLFAPAVVALFVLFLRDPAWPVALTLAAASASLALVHPTYALFLAIPLLAFVVARVVLARGADLRSGLGALVAFGLPMALAFAWLRPIIQQTVALHLGPNELKDSLHHYQRDLSIQSLSRYNLAPGRIDHQGSVAIAALALVPLAFLARRRRWGALVLGGTVAILALELWPLVFPHFSNLVSLSQSRRATLFIPFAVAFAGGAAVVASFSRTLALLAALGLGIWLQLAQGGDFGGRQVLSTVTAIPVWIALYGGVAALVVGAVLVWLPRVPSLPEPGRRGITVAFAALLFVLPVAAHGFSHWAPTKTADPKALTPGLTRFLQRDVSARSVVFADLETSYRATAFAPVYVVAVPPSHVANTKPNRVRARKRAVLKFFRHPGLTVPRNWHADWLILTRGEPIDAIERAGLRPVYRDGRFVVFRL
ncbi:MAG: hypothetical protein ACJ75G_00740 [Gaiellaceae bacterium]